MKSPITFIIGTDTGVGKTVLTGHLLHYLRQRKVGVAVLKPFCSGGRDDAIRLAGIMGEGVALDTINPFHFNAPLTPMAAARQEQRVITIADCLVHVNGAAKSAESLLVEGAGGVMSPLGQHFDALDLIIATGAASVLVAPNRLGVLNQVLLNLKVMQQAGCLPPALVLMGMEIPDESAVGNAEIIKEKHPELAVLQVPFLGPDPLVKASMKASEKKIEKTLATITGRP